jgi:predicted nucleotidyltransferase
MREGAEYEKSYPQTAGERLVIPGNKEGKFDLSFYDVAKSLDEKLREVPGYVGVVSVGSHTRGFADRYSDFDTIVLYDSTQQGSNYAKLESRFSKHWSILNATEGKQIDGAMVDLNPDLVRDDLVRLSRGGRIGTVSTIRLGAMFAQTAIGERLDEYKREMVTTLKQLRGNSVDELGLLLAKAMVEEERSSEPKLKERFGVLTQKQIDTMWSERTEIWRKQILEAVRLYS